MSDRPGPSSHRDQGRRRPDHSRRRRYRPGRPPGSARVAVCRTWSHSARHPGAAGRCGDGRAGGPGVLPPGGRRPPGATPRPWSASGSRTDDANAGRRVPRCCWTRASGRYPGLGRIQVNPARQKDQVATSFNRLPLTRPERDGRRPGTLRLPMTDGGARRGERPGGGMPGMTQLTCYGLGSSCPGSDVGGSNLTSTCSKPLLRWALA